jgi:hypothetical protein
MRSNFELSQMITIVVGDLYLDLHNCFDFVGCEYRATEKKAWLKWQRGAGDWVAKDLPKKLTMSFEGVSNFAAQRRDDAMPFSEDNCVSSITFLPHELGDDFEAICPGHRSADEHLSIGFQSDAAIKIWAESVRLEIGPD